MEQEANRRRIHETASGEEAATLIKGLLYGKKGEPELMGWLETLPGFKESTSWNICLIRTVPELYTEVRSRTVSLLAGYQAVVTIDLEAGLLGIVYGMTEGSGDAAGIAEVLVTLLREYGGENIHIALGTPEDSLVSIEGSYGRAKETLLHFFYEPEQAGVLAYSAVQDQPFSYHYDHIGLMDALLDCVNLLDADGYREALEAAARSFREQQVAPEVVRKFVIHLMYRIFALAPGAEAAGEEGGVASGVEVSEIQQAMTPLSGLLSRLLSYGGKAIDLLVQEQNYKSHGIVREINQYIGEHYQESLSIQKLAEIFFLHPVYLGQLLIKKNGMTFNEQLHHLRIQAAAEPCAGAG